MLWRPTGEVGGPYSLGEVREGERNRGLILVPAREKGRVLAHTRLTGDGQMGGNFLEGSMAKEGLPSSSGPITLRAMRGGRKTAHKRLSRWWEGN